MNNFVPELNYVGKGWVFFNMWLSMVPIFYSLFTQMANQCSLSPLQADMAEIIFQSCFSFNQMHNFSEKQERKTFIRSEAVTI